MHMSRPLTTQQPGSSSSTLGIIRFFSTRMTVRRAQVCVGFHHRSQRFRLQSASKGSPCSNQQLSVVLLRPPVLSIRFSKRSPQGLLSGILSPTRARCPARRWQGCSAQAGACL